MVKPKQGGALSDLLSAVKILNIVSICIFVFGIVAIVLGGIIYGMGKNSAGLDAETVAQYNSISQQRYTVAEGDGSEGVSAEDTAENSTAEVTRTYTRNNRYAAGSDDPTEMADYIKNIGKIIVGFGILCMIMSVFGFIAARGKFALPVFIVGLIITVLVAAVFFLLTDKFTFIYFLLYFIYTLCSGSIAFKKAKQGA